MISDEILAKLARCVAVSVDEFGRTFARAQSQRDSVQDHATVAALYPDVPTIIACLRFAREEQFLRRLLRKSIEAQVAGPILSPNGQVFAELCREHAGVTPSLDVDTARAAIEEMALALTTEKEGAVTQPVFDRQAVNPQGYDAEVAFLAAQLQNTMRKVCRIVDGRNGVSGSGVLIAPHLVATAAHVLEPLLDRETGDYRTDAADTLKVKLDMLATSDAEADRTIDVAEKWLVAEARCDFQRDAAGKLTLPPPEQLMDSHDVAILRLKDAPGLTRGWVSLEQVASRGEPNRHGLLLHHHPGGGAQMVSYGSHKGAHGSRFLHSCSSLGGSSGGPLISQAARIVGLHHGAVKDADPVLNVGGGGAWLARWWREHPDDHMPDPSLNPLWEWRPAGAVGTGIPVIGFESLQHSVWFAQLATEPMAAVVSMPRVAGALLVDIISSMLPPGGATVLRIRRAELDRIAMATLESREPTSAVLEALANQLQLPVAAAPTELPTSDLSTDSVRAANAVAALADRLGRVQAAGPVWLLVHVEDKPMRTAASEALGYLYRALLSIQGGRGRLLVIGDHPGMAAAVQDMLRDSVSGPVLKWSFAEPSESDIETYLVRWAQAVAPDKPDVRASLQGSGWLFLKAAQAAVIQGGDFYAALCDLLREQFDRALGIRA
ncbi:MAG TPA: trypsin-like peptidase domain-containing protein [Allosphingosinicella sp.]|nr:trypsin-like peptidase domain-containing protein [Allosphingosinicella sp.]